MFQTDQGTCKTSGEKKKITNRDWLKKFNAFKNFHYWDKPQRKLWSSSLNSMSEKFEFTHLLKGKGWSIALQGLSTNGFLFPAQDCCSSFIHSFIHSSQPCSCANRLCKQKLFTNKLLPCEQHEVASTGTPCRAAETSSSLIFLFPLISIVNTALQPM